MLMQVIALCLVTYMLWAGIQAAIAFFTMLRYQQRLKEALVKRYLRVGQRAPMNPFLSEIEVKRHFAPGTDVYRHGMIQAQALRRFIRSGKMMAVGVGIIILLTLTGTVKTEWKSAAPATYKKSKSSGDAQSNHSHLKTDENTINGNGA